ncbi:MAG: CDP-alcohol phosphatidyltransferase family protein [Phycisphaerales bacterium]|nr:CDP-alcohol phosphatidyltransferase family protein [Phycisphaerales bacterium]
MTPTPTSGSAPPELGGPLVGPTLAKLPNALTLARLVMAAIVFLLLSLADLASDPGPARALAGVAAGLFVVAALTDAADGWLARRWRVISRFGRVMDPFADKVLVLGAFVLLAGPQFQIPAEGGAVQASGVLPWMAVVILARELLVTSLRGLVEGAGGDFSAMMSGKVKMIAQSVGAPAIMLIVALAEPGSPSALTLASVCAWAVTLISAASAVPYITRAIACVQQQEERSPS